MPTRPFRISARAHPQRYLDHRGGGQASHLRYINGRPFYFVWCWNAEGSVHLRVRTLVPSPTPYPAEGWQTIHQLTNY